MVTSEEDKTCRLIGEAETRERERERKRGVVLVVNAPVLPVASSWGVRKMRDGLRSEH